MSAASQLDIIPKKSSKDIEWIAWYESLPFSRKDNNLLFIKVWKVRQGSSANTDALRRFLAEKGISLSADNKIEAILSSAKGAVTGTLEFVGDMVKANLVVSGAIVVGVVIFAGVLIWRIVTPDNVGRGLEVAANLSPMGRLK
jgi:hypothetical protein